MYLKNFALTKVGFIGILDIEKLLQWYLLGEWYNG
jgi:hypothetical protein